MKTVTLHFALLVISTAIFCSAASAQTPLPYSTGFDDPSQQSGWQEFRQGVMSVQNWILDTGGISPTHMLSHDYPVGNPATDTVTDWYISPPFDFSGGGQIDSLKLRLFAMNNSTTPEDQLQIYLLKDAPHPEAAITLLADLTGMASDSMPMWKDTGNFAIPPTTGTCYIAFKYRATNDWFTAAIDDVYISGNAATSVAGKNIEPGEIQAFPNPASQTISLRLPDTKMRTIYVYDVLGKCIQKQDAGAKNVSLDVSTLARATYNIVILQNGKTEKVIKWIKD